MCCAWVTAGYSLPRASFTVPRFEDSILIFPLLLSSSSKSSLCVLPRIVPNISNMSEDTAALYVSNGTCYYGEGQVSNPRYIPCGNAYLSGVQHCCYEGDYCLSSYACYDASSMPLPF